MTQGDSQGCHDTYHDDDNDNNDDDNDINDDDLSNDDISPFVDKDHPSQFSTENLPEILFPS